MGQSEIASPRSGPSDAQVSPEMVRFRPEIEPVVRLIEETPRERALEVAIGQLKTGLSYRNLLAGLFLAGIRNIKPRPVGFKFHAVMVMNSAHLLGQSSAVTERLLPLLWALDNFKASQAQDVKEGDWALEPVDESPTAQAPSGEEPSSSGRWRRGTPTPPTPPSRALCRALGRRRDDGAALASRRCATSGTSATRRSSPRRAGGPCRAIGWEHAEPVLRSLVFGMLDLQGDARPRPVGPYEANLENAAQDPHGLADRPRRPGRHASAACKSSARRRPKRPRPRQSSCSTRESHRARSGTPSSCPPASS